MDKLLVSVACKQLQKTDDERGTNTYSSTKENVIVEFPNGNCLELSDKEVLYQASMYAKDIQDLILQHKQ